LLRRNISNISTAEAVHTHSGLRWVVLLLMLMAIINAARSQSSGTYSNATRKLNLFAMISLHVQLLVGIALLFMSQKVNFSIDNWMSSDTAMGMYRFFNLEHIFGMVLAIALVTMGRSKAEKKLKGSRDKHRRIMFSYLLGLILILLTIPWPFRAHLGGAWF